MTVYRDELERQAWERDVACGLADPGLTDREADHDNQLEQADRLYRHTPARVAYTERPSDRERAAHYDETRVRALTHPRTGNVEVQPRRVPCNCGAAQRGLRHAGPAHRYGCPLHAHTVDPETQAA